MAFHSSKWTVAAQENESKATAESARRYRWKIINLKLCQPSVPRGRSAFFWRCRRPLLGFLAERIDNRRDQIEERRPDKDPENRKNHERGEDVRMEEDQAES